LHVGVLVVGSGPRRPVVASRGTTSRTTLVPSAVVSTVSPDPASLPTAFMDRERRSLPQWLTTNRSKLKAATYLAGAAAVTTVGAVYGNDISAAVNSGLHTLWGATLTVLKVVGIAVGVGLALRLIFGGSSRGRRPRTGTFEGSLRGTWRED
uniref:hypothetical protein n=1 Tax=Streptomyces sp. IBSBF 2950 TaxID=2903528 RepID=UPI002FDC208F